MTRRNRCFLCFSLSLDYLLLQIEYNDLASLPPPTSASKRRYVTRGETACLYDRLRGIGLCRKGWVDLRGKNKKVGGRQTKPVEKTCTVMCHLLSVLLRRAQHLDRPTIVNAPSKRSVDCRSFKRRVAAPSVNDCQYLPARWTIQALKHRFSKYARRSVFSTISDLFFSFFLFLCQVRLDQCLRKMSPTTP